MKSVNCVVCEKKVKMYATIEDICISCYNKGEGINSKLELKSLI